MMTSARARSANARTATAQEAQVSQPERRRHRVPARGARRGRGRRRASSARPRRARARRGPRPRRSRAPIRRSCRGRADRARRRGSSCGVLPPSLTSKAKKGPDRTRPKSRMSSFMIPVTASSAARTALLCVARALAAVRASRAASLASNPRPRAGCPPGRALRQPVLAHADEEVFDDGAHQRRVVADPRDAKARRLHDPFEVGDVRQRVQVVRLAQAFAGEIGQSAPLGASAPPVHGLRPPAIQAFLRTWLYTNRAPPGAITRLVSGASRSGPRATRARPRRGRSLS